MGNTKSPLPSTACTSTRVTLLFQPPYLNVWLRFGNIAAEVFCNRSRRIVTLLPSSVFCRVHWEANQYGTQLWRLAVLQCGAGSQRLQRIVGIEPGAIVLLQVAGSKKIMRLLQLIDAIEARGFNAADVSPAYWRSVHNRVAARRPLPEYNEARHAGHRARERLA